MSLNFQDSKKQLSSTTSTPMSLRTMSLSNDTSTSSVEETFVYDKYNYSYYDSYQDNNLSYVDKNKNIIINEQQHSVTQETNSQCIPFELDRYYDGVDLKDMKFNIHYVNVKNKEGVSIPINFAYSESKIRFGWLLDSNVTYVDGDITFEIVASGVNEKNESYIWRTRPNGKINILKALTGEASVKPTQTWYTQFITVINEKLGEAAQSAQDAEAAANKAESAYESTKEIETGLVETVEQSVKDNIALSLGNYYTKEESYNQEEINNMIESIDGLADFGVDYDTETEKITFVNNKSEETIGEVSLDINDKIQAALDTIDGLAAFGTEYDSTTETIHFKNNGVVMAEDDVKLDIALKIQAAISQIDGLANFDVTYDGSKMVFYNGETVIKEIAINSDPSEEWTAEYDAKVDEKIKVVSDDVAIVKSNLASVTNEVGQVKGEVSTLSGGMEGVNAAIATMQQEIEGFTSNVYEATYGTSADGVENTFILWENGEVKNQFVIQGGSGGGTAATTLVVERITQSPLTITPTDKAIIEFNCTSTDSDGQTVDCSYTLKKGSTVIKSGSLTQGYNSFDLTEYTSVGTQKFTLTVSDDGGSVNVKTWTIQVVDIRLVSSFNDQLTYTAQEPVSFTYTPYGAVEKTVHFKLDGVELTSVTTTVSGLLQSYTLPAQEHGAHLLECYITATLNGVEVETDHIYKDIIWYDENSTVPVIGCIYRNDYYGNVPVKQYSATSIVYTVYDPNTITPTVSRTIDGEPAGTQVLETNTDIWSYKSSKIGERILVISCGKTSVTVVMDVEELGIDVKPITANLGFDFNPVGYSNTSDSRLWVDKTNIAVSLSVSDNFDWTNGGYQLDENGDQYFCVKSGTTATINYNLFADDAKKNGKEFKCIFKITNVKKRDSSFLSCIENNIGLDMKVESANIYSSNGSLYAPYCEDDIIEFEFNISKDTDIPMVMTYEDGVASRPMIYASDTSFMQNTAQPITIGSPNCDVHIYRMKAYYASLTDSDILANFIADARTAEEMISRYTRNQIYDENGALTPEVLAEKCPDLRIIMIDAGWFTNDKDDKVKNTTVRQIYKGGDPVLDNWTCTGAQHSGRTITCPLYMETYA